nr:hypothetical protein Iba_scaffold8049CG0030 [Ipomoea batatas]
MRGVCKEICSHKCSIRMTTNSNFVWVSHLKANNFFYCSLCTCNKLFDIPVCCLFIAFSYDRYCWSR